MLFLSLSGGCWLCKYLIYHVVVNASKYTVFIYFYSTVHSLIKIAIRKVLNKYYVVMVNRWLFLFLSLFASVSCHNSIALTFRSSLLLLPYSLPHATAHSNLIAIASEQKRHKTRAAGEYLSIYVNVTEMFLRNYF